MKRRPTSLRIGGRSVPIHWQTTEEFETVEDLTDSNGVFICQGDRYGIFMRNNLDPGLEAEVLLHEAIHAWLQFMGHCAESGKLSAGSSEERLVTCFACCFTSLVAENPQFMAYWIQRLKGD